MGNSVEYVGGWRLWPASLPWEGQWEAADENSCWMKPGRRRTGEAACPRDTAAMVPRVLVVVLVPEDLDNWLQQSEQCLRMKHCAYWVSLYGMEESPNSASITVRIPRSQIFDVAGVHQIMERIGRGDAL